MTEDDSSTRDLMVRGIAAVKAKENNEARYYFEWLLRLDPPEDERIDALYWLSEISPDRTEQRSYLEDILAIDLGEPRARRKLAILDGRLDPTEIVNPDHLPQPVVSEPMAAIADRFVCPNCGGRMTYAPDGQSLTCEFCEARQHLEAERGEHLTVPEDDFTVAMATAGGHLKPATVHTFTCQGCGVVFILPPNQLSVTCPYCQSSYALEQTELRELLIPNGVIPFILDEPQVSRCLKAWIEAQHGTQQQGNFPLAALYLPLWSFYIDGDISWRCEKHINRDWIELKGTEPILFDQVLIPATDHQAILLRMATSCFNLTKLVPFDERYLAGRIAESYRVPVADASLDARQSILSKVKNTVLENLTGQVRNLTMNSAKMRVETFELILAPVWVTQYEERGDRFAILLDGQKGEVFAVRKS